MPTLTRGGTASTSTERSVPGVIPDDDPGPPAGVGINRQEARSAARGGGALGLSARSRRQPRYEGDAMCLTSRRVRLLPPPTTPPPESSAARTTSPGRRAARDLR